MWVRSRASLRALEEMKSQPMLVIEPRFLGLHPMTILADYLLRLMDGCASSSLSLRMDITLRYFFGLDLRIVTNVLLLPWIVD